MMILFTPVDVCEEIQDVLGDEIFDWGLRDSGTSPVLSVDLVGGFL